MALSNGRYCSCSLPPHSLDTTTYFAYFHTETISVIQKCWEILFSMKSSKKKWIIYVLKGDFSLISFRLNVWQTWVTKWQNVLVSEVASRSTHTRLTLTKRFTNLNLSWRQKNQAILCSDYLWIWILLSFNYNFFYSEGLQGTHMGALVHLIQNWLHWPQGEVCEPFGKF